MIPLDSKYAVLALKCEAKLGGSSLEIADRVWALHEPPVELPAHWKTWLGSIEAERLDKCRLFLLAVARSKELGVVTEENAWLEDRLHLLFRGLLLASVGMRVDYGLSFSGSQKQGELDVRNTQKVDPVTWCPGSPPHFVVTKEQLIHAERVGRALRSLRGGGGRFGRLWRALGAFDLAVSTRDLSLRLHQLVRAIEGVVPIPGSKPQRGGLSQRDWFAAKVGLLVTGANSKLNLLMMYDSRGATEHLERPIRNIRVASPALTPDEAELSFAELTFLTEGIARHALLKVIETAAIKAHYESDDTILAFWQRSDAAILADWGPQFPVDVLHRHFDPRIAASQLRYAHEQQLHWRKLYAKAPPEFTGDA